MSRLALSRFASRPMLDHENRHRRRLGVSRHGPDRALAAEGPRRHHPHAPDLAAPTPAQPASSVRRTGTRTARRGPMGEGRRRRRRRHQSRRRIDRGQAMVRRHRSRRFATAGCCATRSLTTAIREAAAAARRLHQRIRGRLLRRSRRRNADRSVRRRAPIFSPGVARDWEAAASEVANVTRVALIRTGIVLDRRGGALPKMLPPFHDVRRRPARNGRRNTCRGSTRTTGCGWWSWTIAQKARAGRSTPRVPRR